MVTVDAVVFADGSGEKHVALVRRKNEPYKGSWALPGGFVEMDESLDKAVMRELQEETGLRNVPLTQLHCFGDPGRDPRGRTISVVFAGELLSKDEHGVRGRQLPGLQGRGRFLAWLRQWIL